MFDLLFDLLNVGISRSGNVRTEKRNPGTHAGGKAQACGVFASETLRKASKTMRESGDPDARSTGASVLAKHRHEKAAGRK